VFGQDGDFSWDLFEKSYNADLANNLGNLVNRVTSMAHRYRGGALNGPGVAAPTLTETVAECVDAYISAMDDLRLSEGAAAIVRVIDAANESIAATEPWKLAKAGDDRGLDAALWNATEALRIAAVLLTPFMPGSSVEILRRLGVGHESAQLDRHASWHAAGARTLEQGPLLWPRLEAPPAAAAETTGTSTKETRVTDQPNPNPPAIPATTGPAPAAPAPGTAPVPAAPWPMETRLSIDDFMKIDLRVARVLTAERVPNSKKLMKMEVDLGVEKRTIVAGIAEAYEADALVGRHVAIVANLKPAKLMGIESNGMVLAASPDGGKPMLVAFDQTPPPGTRVR
jgi:methionyl-tRNA synthetase